MRKVLLYINSLQGGTGLVLLPLGIEFVKITRIFLNAQSVGERRRIKLT